MKQRKIIAILTLVCFMFTLLPVTVMAEVLNENGGVSETAETEAATSGTCGENLTWELVDGVLTISGSGEIQYNPWRDTIGSITKVIINEGVTAISANAFNSGTAIVEVNFPDSLIEIGANAFYGCSLLKSINLPETLNSIGNAAFYGCEELESVNFPTGLAGISDFAFWGCKSLQNVNFPNALTSIGADSFSGCASFTQISIPENVSSIGKRAFYGCTAIEEIYFFGNVPTFEENFVLDPALEATLYYPADNMTWDFETNGLNVASFGGNYITWVPYDAPEKVVSVELGKTNTTLIVGNTEQLTAKINPDKADNKTVFWESSDDTVVTVNENGLLTAVSVGSAKVKVTTEDGGFVAECEVSVIANENMQSGYCNFYNSEYGKNVYWAYDPKTSVLTLQGEGEIIDFYPDSAYSTPAVFREAKTIIIKEGITSVGSFVFAKNSNLENVCFPSTLKSIHQNAFEFCTKLEILSIPDSVTEIQGNAFSQCLGLKSVDTGDGVTSFSGFSFHDLTQSDLSDGYYSAIQLNNIVIGNSIEEIPENMFRNCGSLTDIIIPDSVVTIGDYAFSNCDGLENVMIPDTVLNLGKGVLAACDNLKAVSLGNGIETINAGVFYNCKQLVTVELGEDATCIEDSYIIDLQEPAGGVFENCISLQSITLPNQLQKIGTEAFKGCTNLEKIELPETVASLGENAFAGCSKLFTVSLGSNITEITPGTFMDCDNLQEIVIQGAVNEIGDSAFKNCISLEMVSWPDKLQTIGEYAFENCKVLKEIVLPDTVTSVGYGAFKDCLGIEKIVLSDNMTTFDGNNICDENTGKLYLLDTGNGIDYVPYLGKRAFEVVETVIIGNSVKNIDNNEFENCINLKELILGNSVNKIGRSAFSGCSALSGVRFPSSVETIENNAFNGCSSLTEIVLPDSVENLGNGAFSGCTAVEKVDTGNGISELAGFDFYDYANLKTVTIGDNVTTIPEKTFKNLTQLNSVTMGENITSIGSNAFENCSSLTAIKIPTGVMELEDSTFSGCTSLSSINIPNGLTNIGVNAFNNCSSLDTITLPDSMEQIGAYAFADCKELSSINIPGGLDSISNGVFSGCSNLKEVKIPDGVTSIGANAFENADSLKIVVLPNSITTISTKAFANSDALISIVVPDSVTLISSTAFTGSNNLTIYGYAGSYAETYAKQEEIPFVALTEGDIPSTEGTIISILSETYELKVGEANAIPLMYGITPDSAKEQDVTWTIADESIIKSVDVPVGGYWIEGLKPGTTAITATTEDGASSTRTITVANENISGTNGTTISIYTDKELVCNVGSTLEVQANALYAVPVGERGTITWSIGNPAVLEEVSVKTDMLKGCSTIQVKGLQSGETTLTATTSDGSSATTTVKVMTVIKHDYRTLVGILQGYDAATKQICVDGSYYPVASAVSIGDDLSSINVTDMIGKQVHVLLDNGEVISFGTMESVKTRVDILWIAASTGRNVIYQNGKYDKDTIPVTINIKNSVQLSSGYDLSVICKYLDSSAVLKDLSWESSALELHNAEGIKGVTLAPNERHNVEAILKISSGYVPERVTEQISGQATVTAQIRGEACSAQDWINISVGNLDLQQEIAAIQKEQREEKEKPTSESIKNNATSVDKELDNSSSQLILPQNLDWYVMKDPLEKQKLRETIMLWLATVATEPEEKNFTDKLEEKIYTKATKSLKADLKEYFSFKTFGELKEWLGIGVRTVQSSIRVRITTKTAGPQEIILTYNGLIMEAGKKPNGSMGKVTWEFADENAPEYLKAYAKNDFGMSIEADVAAFSEYLYNTAEKAVKDAWDETTGDAINDVASMVTSDLTQTIIKKTCGSFSDGLFDLITGITKRQKINCPVDVYVYDLDGNLCGSIVHNEVQTGKNKVYLYVEDDSKNVWYTGDDYKIKLVGNDTGTMDYTITEFNAENEAIRTVNFYNIPLTTETIYYGAVPMEVFADVAKYQLNEQDGGIITADEDSYIPPVFSEEKETVTIGIDSLTAKVKDNKVNFTARVTDAVTSIVAVSLYYVDGKDVISSEMTYDEALNIWHAETPLVEPVQAFIMAVNANGQQAVKDVDSVESTPDSVAPGGGSSSGGFNGVYNYPVKLNGAVNGATVLFDKANANVGETVTITVKPDAGKKVDEVIVTDANGKEITVTKVGDNKYTFTMPAGKVNVAVTTEAADYDKRIVLQINNKNIVINDKNISNDVSPVIVGERTMVPIRVVTELLGGTAEWNEDIRTVTLKIDDKVLSMIIDQPIPGFGTSATIINNRTYVPIRYVAEKLGANVEWIQAAQQIVIEK